jgi:hypothetical protein
MIGALPIPLRTALTAAMAAVEFDKLTDAFVLSDACRRLQCRFGVLVDPQNPAAGPRESYLSETEYLQACRRWLQAIELYHPKFFPVWKSLYDEHWFGSNIPSRSFEERKEYDILLRSAARPVGQGKPAWHYANLWERAENIVAKRKTDAMNSKTSALEAELADVKRLAASLATSSKAAAATATSYSSAPRSGDAESSTKKPSTSQGFRGNKKERASFCYACGSNYHHAADCNASKKVVGSKGNLFVRREGSNWVIAGVGDDQKQFCFAWNLPGGCKNRSCNRGQHLCSLCGSTAHGAPSCSA